jgi:hypothetical protein
MNARNRWGRGPANHAEYIMKRNQRIQDNYTAAMVLLRMAGADEHTINKFRTVTLGNMKKFTRHIHDHIKWMELSAGLKRNGQTVTGRLSSMYGMTMQNPRNIVTMSGI